VTIEQLDTVVNLDSENGYTALPIPDQTPGWETFWIDDFQRNQASALSATVAQEITAIALAARESAQHGGRVSL